MSSLTDKMESLWSLSSPDPQWARQSGKLETEGGSQVGLPLATQAHVGLLSLLFSGIAEGEFCGAPIGRGKKMCVRFDCDVSSHGTKAKTTEVEFGGPGPQVFIKMPPHGRENGFNGSLLES
jgi:hypothetical protein